MPPRITKDLDAIDRGDYPEWKLQVQILSDDEHPELDFDPLDDTKVWLEDVVPLLPVGRMVLDRNITNHHNENEQVAFGTGVLVDGLDFSDDKMLVGRTFSYSDTQRYHVGPNYLQLPVNQPSARPATNQRGGQMEYSVDLGEEGQSLHTNYEPSTLGGLREADYPTHDEQGPVIEGRLTRQRIPRTNDYQQAADRYHLMVDWERDDLINNFVDQLGQCDRHVQERMVWHFYLIDDDFGNRVGEGLGIKAADVAHLDPLPKQQLTDEDRQRLSNFGNNPPRELSAKQMTGCVHVMQADEASANGSTNGAAYTASRMQSSRSDG